MANRYVRVYNGPEGSNIIGFSASAVPERSDDFPGFMQSQGYEVEQLNPWGDEAVPEHREAVNAVGGVSLAYYGIRPPLQEQHHQPLVDWCDEHIPVGGNYGFILDERNRPVPSKPFCYERERIIGRWVGTTNFLGLVMVMQEPYSPGS